MQIGFAIWLLRQSREMTQSQLATRMRTSRQQISDLEIFQLPTVSTLFRVARALQVSPACLIRLAEGRRKVSDLPPRCGTSPRPRLPWSTSEPDDSGRSAV